MNADDINFTYDLLGHKEQTEIRLIHPKKKLEPKSIFVNNKEDFLRVCQENNGKYNVYAGINERNNNGTEGKDVITVNSFIVDIDAKRPDNKTPATDVELKNVEVVAKAIELETKELGYNSHIACSGNGYQIWYPLAAVPARESLEEQIKILQRKFKEQFQTPYVDIDNIGDLPRIIKVIGTLNIKGNSSVERPHRVSSWINENEKIIKNKKLIDDIGKIELPKKPAVSPYTQMSDGDLEKISTDDKISSLLAGNWNKYYKSRSEAEMGLVCALAARGVSKEHIFDFMNSCAIGKWQEKPESYREITYENAINFISKDTDVVPVGEKPPSLEHIFIHKYNKAGDVINTKTLTGVLGNYISFIYSFKTLYDTEEVFVYSNGVYIPGETLIKSECQKIVGPELIKTNYVNEAIDFIKRKTYEDRECFDMDDKLINLKNGLYDVENKKLIKHTPDYLSFIQLPVEYNPQAECVLWKKYLNDTLATDEDRTILQEIAGWVFMSGYDIQKAALLEGRGGNGKSVYLDTITAMIGADNVSSVSWQDLSDDKYAKAQLYGKMANIHSDLPKKAIVDTSAFQAITGGDKIWSDIKHSVKGINFYNRAKIMYATNKIPRVIGATDAFFDRIILITFPYKIRGTKKEDKKLKKKLLDELSGIFNWALIGMDRLLKKECFSTSKTTEEFKEIYLKKSDTIVAFFDDMIEKGERGSKETKEGVYQAYVGYCRDFLKENPIGKQLFGKEFGKQAGYVGSGQRKIVIEGEEEEVRTNCWIGINVKYYTWKNGSIVFLKPTLLNSQNTIDTIQVPDIAESSEQKENSWSRKHKFEQKSTEKVKISDKNDEKNIVSIVFDEKPQQKERVLTLLESIRVREKNFNAPVFKSELADEYQLKNISLKQLENDLDVLIRDSIIYDPDRNGRYKVI